MARLPKLIFLPTMSNVSVVCLTANHIKRMAFHMDIDLIVPVSDPSTVEIHHHPWRAKPPSNSSGSGALSWPRDGHQELPDTAQLILEALTLVLKHYLYTF